MRGADPCYSEFEKDTLNMELLKPNGEKVTAVVTDAKKEHDSAELQQERIRLTNLLQKYWAEYQQDLQGDPKQTDLINVDRPKLREYYGAKWKNLIDGMNTTSFPHPADAQAMYKLIDQYHEHTDQEAEYAKPLAEIKDLSPMALVQFGTLPDGKLFINDRVALCISEHGSTKVWLRGKHETADEWCRGWMPTPARLEVVDSVDYTVRELHTLVSATRFSRVAQLTSEQLALCATPSTKKKGFLG